MSTLAQAFEHAMRPGAETPIAIQRFSPAEIRVAMADLVSSDQLLLADALGVAGLTFYPDSEDILATCALLAEVRQDWEEADRLLGQMVAANGMSATPTTWLHWVRVIQCRLDTERASQVAQLAICEHPTDPALHELLDHLNGTLVNELLTSQSASAHANAHPAPTRSTT